MKSLQVFGEKLAPSTRRVFHAVEVPEEKVAVLAAVFVAFGALAVDGWLVGVDDALNEGNCNIILVDIEARNGCESE